MKERNHLIKSRIPKVLVFGELGNDFDSVVRKISLKVEKIDLSELKNNLFYSEKNAKDLLENHIVLKGVSDVVKLFWRKKR